MVCRVMLVWPVNHGDIQTILVGDCTCISSDSTGAYVHDLSLATKEVSPMEEMQVLSAAPGGDGARMGLLSGPGAGHPGSVPFVSHRPGAYGRLLLAVYVRWQTGLLVASDWLRPVTREGGGGLAGGPTSHGALCGRRQLTRTWAM